MASIQELKRLIDLHDLAEKLGLERPGGQGNYRSPHHKDKNPSLSVFNDGKAWKDHSGDAGGDCISFVQFVENLPDVPSAMRRLHELYNLPNDKPAADAPRRERSKEEFIADQCLAKRTGAFDYLKGRGISENALMYAADRGTLGFNDWTKPGMEPGSFGYGGPAAAFIVRDLQTGEALAVDFRYLDPSLNGDVKTKSVGPKDGVPWFACARRVKAAETIYIVESSINALCIEATNMHKAAAVALRGASNWQTIDWRFCIGKQAVLVLDADLPNEKGERPGAKAAWGLYDLLTGLNVATVMVDQASWYADDVNDVADIAKKFGLDNLKERLQTIEPWCIPGLVGKDGPGGKQRVYLPAHDFAVYWRYRAKPDFTTFVSKVEKDGDDGGETLKFEDLCGFRIASITRVTIAGATSTMSGETDDQPETQFAVSVQTPRHGGKLVRRVYEDDKLHNTDQWKKFGPIFNQSKFLRLVNILERTAHCGARDAVNFVGLCWRNGKLVVNEGPDCYFREPEKQCPYNLLTFPSGPRADARKVIEAYQTTFKDNAAAILLVWGLGGHLKAFLGFWPHLICQAAKGSGKSTLIKRLERSIGMTMFSGQSLQTEFRQLTTVSYTSHPVGWEELSARKQEIIDKAVAMLQECYQYTPTKRGSDMLPYLLCAPVLLAGEDVPVRSLLGKVVQTDLTKRKGPKMPENLPRFPVRPFLEYLTTLTREGVVETMEKAAAWLRQGSRSPDDSEGAQRAVLNFAAVLTAWKLLADFAGMEVRAGSFMEDLRAQMNAFIRDTEGERQPFVWIMEIVASEIESKQFLHPYEFDEIDGEDCIIFRPQHAMDHISSTGRLREHWNGLPVKSGRVFKQQLAGAGVIVKDELDRRIHQRRHAHLSAISLKKLAGFGVYLSQPEPDYQQPPLRAAANS
jgi:hypothetical protein